MTKLEIIENSIDAYYSDNNNDDANRFTKLYWDCIEKEVSGWSGNYFDANIVEYLQGFFSLNFEPLEEPKEFVFPALHGATSPDYYGSPNHARFGDAWFFGDDFYS